MIGFVVQAMGPAVPDDVYSIRSSLGYFASSGTWLNAGALVTILISFVLSIAYANVLPKEVFGTYQYLLTLFSLLTGLTLTGMNSAITRSVAQGYEGSLRASIGPQLRWNSLAAGAALCISLYYALAGNSILSIGALLIALALPLVTTFNSYNAFLIGKQAYSSHFIYAVIASLLYFIAILAAILLYPHAIVLIAVNLAITTFTAVLLYALTIRRFKPNRLTDADSIGYGKHLTVMNSFGTISSQLDNLLVFHFLGPAALATYAFATLIPERLGGFLKNLTSSALPRFAEQRMDSIRTYILKIGSLLMLGIVLCAALYAGIAPYLFALVYPQYIDAVPYSQVFALTLLMAVGNFVGMSLLAHRRIRRLYLVNTAFPIAQILLQVFGILGWGLWGLIIGRLLAIAFFLALIIPLVMIERHSPAFDAA